MLAVCAGLLCSIFLSMQMSMTAQASNTKNYVNDLNGGVASILDPGYKNSTEVINATVRELNLTFPSEDEIGDCPFVVFRVLIWYWMVCTPDFNSSCRRICTILSLAA